MKVDGAKIPTCEMEGLKHSLFLSDNCHEGSKLWQMGRVDSRNNHGVRGVSEVCLCLALVR